MSLLAIIPARGGSKSIPRKNIKELCGKPLIAWTIEAAQQVSEIDRIIVSTEDEEIARVAEAWGAEVPFLRPIELAQDDTPGIDPVLHALEELPEFSEVILLQPTSPLRKREDLRGLLVLSKKQNAPSVVSVTLAGKHPFWMYRLGEGQELVPWLDVPFVSNRQDLPAAYALNGALYWAKTSWLLQHQSFLTAETLGYPMPPERSADLDTPMDWEWVEFLMQRN